jgi:thiazole/oxazole-forming peptide maturase SagD family component
MPLDPDASIDWTPIWSLSNNEFKYIPTGYAYYGYPHRDDQFFCWSDSNGNAAGNTLEEAIVQGFMELVERDAVSLWWNNRIRRPAVDIASFDDLWLAAVARYYEEQARPLWVLDLTSDLGEPTFAAISRRVDKPVEDILLAFGAHFDPRIALRRAVTEMNQFLPAVLPIQADGSGDYAYPDPESMHWWQTATLETQPYLAPADDLAVRRLDDFAFEPTDDLLTDVNACKALVESRGLELLVLDQTRPDIGLPVVKVIVPGLRHFWARFAPGRLYDVPVAMGWLPRKLDESELNPIPLFL